ncbi:Deubiquitinase OTUD6B [Coccomyxa sp. Obi]|nr:Deubiquitinase OTUD6B [Coccomyxa sp. Obi]
MGRKGGGRNAFVKATLHKTAEDDGPVESAAGNQTEPAVQTQNGVATGDQDTSKSVKVECAKAPAVTVSASDHNEDETRGQMVQRHKRELKVHKEAMKKLGKKRKDDIEKLDKEISDRHAAELAALEKRLAAEADTPDDGTVKLAESLYDTKLTSSQDKGGPQPSRAQKRRDAKAAQEAEREARIAEEQAAMGDSARVIEERSLAELLSPLGLAVRSIPADGHCLYRAVEEQLGSSGAREELLQPPHDYWAVRAKAAAYMRAHPDQFMPFISLEDGEEDEGGPEAAFEAYCCAVENSAAWGGQLELRALAQALRRHIAVYSVGMPRVDMGPEFQGEDEEGSLRLCYLRHAFGLGEHYNSVTTVAAGGDTDHE